VSRPGRPPLMIRWCEHNRRSDGARGPQRRPCPLARGTRWAAGPGRGGSRPVSGHALHELSCPRGCRKAHPGGHAGDRWAGGGGGAAHLSGREAAADTNMATYTGHWPSGRRSFRKQRTVNLLMVPARYNFLYCSFKAAYGRPPAAAVLGRQRHDGNRGTALTLHPEQGGSSTGQVTSFSPPEEVHAMTSQAQRPVCPVGVG
jgi:hypothetical protein